MKCLVLGVNGQDGSYLCEALLRRGYEVYGLGRADKSRYISNSLMHYIQMDLHDFEGLRLAISEVKPDKCFHFAAVHGAAASGFEYETLFPSMMDVNVVSLQVLLEYARKFNSKMQLIYAGSCKIFPQPWIGELNEDSFIKPSCLYSLGKFTAQNLIRYYREFHFIDATNLILFNHDSPRRRPPFLLALVADTISRAKLDKNVLLSVANLDFWMDWGSAAEFMEVVAGLPESLQFADLIVATGNASYARDVVYEAFQRHGLDPQRHVYEFAKPAAKAKAMFRVDISRLERIGSRLEVKVGAVIDEMVAAKDFDTPHFEL